MISWLVNRFLRRASVTLFKSLIRVEVKLDTAILESLPEVELQDNLQRTKRYRKLTIGDKTFYIGEREVVKGEPKSGAQTLYVYTGNIVGLTPEMMY